jgi:hypothetical protein
LQTTRAAIGPHFEKNLAHSCSVAVQLKYPRSTIARPRAGPECVRPAPPGSRPSDSPRRWILGLPVGCCDVEKRKGCFGSPHWMDLELLRRKSRRARTEIRGVSARKCSWEWLDRPGWVPSP